MEESFTDVLRASFKTDNSDHVDEDKGFYSREEVKMENMKLTTLYKTDIQNLGEASEKIIGLLRDIIAKLESKNIKLEQRIKQLEESLSEKTICKILDDQVIVRLEKEIEELKAHKKVDTSTEYRLTYLIFELFAFASSSCTRIMSVALDYGIGFRGKYFWF